MELTVAQRQSMRGMALWGSAESAQRKWIGLRAHDAWQIESIRGQRNCRHRESVWWNHSKAGPSSPSRIEIRMDLTVPELPASFSQATHTARKALPLKGSLQRLVAVRRQTSCRLGPSNLDQSSEREWIASQVNRIMQWGGAQGVPRSRGAATSSSDIHLAA